VLWRESLEAEGVPGMILRCMWAEGMEGKDGVGAT